MPHDVDIMADRPVRNGGTDEAVWKLAERLWFAMERLEPSLEENDWGGISESGLDPRSWTPFIPTLQVSTKAGQVQTVVHGRRG